jgi:hypothetical protein
MLRMTEIKELFGQCNSYNEYRYKPRLSFTTNIYTDIET